MLWSHSHNAKPARRRFPFHSVGATAPTRNSVGADAYIGPPYRTHVKLPVIAKPAHTLAVAIRNPRPLGPLA